MILRSLRMTGEKVRGATLDANEQVECLAELNTFMDHCNTVRLLCYSIQQNSFALTASTSTYTIGTNGAFVMTRPVKIVDPCFVRDSSGFDTPVTIINVQSYGEITDKDAGYTVPERLYYDTGYSATSTATIHLYPTPTSDLTLFINSWSQLQNFSSITTEVLMPPGYQLFIESNFAIHLAAGFRPVSAELAKIAKESKAAIMGLNSPELVSRLDIGAVQANRSSIFTG